MEAFYWILGTAMWCAAAAIVLQRYGIISIPVLTQVSDQACKDAYAQNYPDALGTIREAIDGYAKIDDDFRQVLLAALVQFSTDCGILKPHFLFASVASNEQKAAKFAQWTRDYSSPNVKAAWIDGLHAIVSIYFHSLPRGAFDDGIRISGPRRIPLNLTAIADAHRAFSMVAPGIARSIDAMAYLKAFVIHGPNGEALRDFNSETTIPEATRFEHHWLIGGSGHGKTQAIQYILAKDIPAILEGKRSVIVIDSQGALIPTIANLQVWRDHPDRLSHIVPWKVEQPIALNLFKVRLPEDKQAAFEFTSHLMESYRFIINSLLKDAELTGKQGIVFDMLLMLMVNIPGADMTTYLELLTDEGFQKYRSYVRMLDPSAQSFFERDYITGKKADQYQSTREEVRRRIQQLVVNPLFGRMFCQPDLKVNFEEEMQAGRMILVDTDKSVLADTNSALMGALFVGLIYRAISSRIPDDPRNTPCFIVIDECFEYFGHTGPLLELILAQARKRNVGLLLSHQNMEQLKKAPGLYESISANTAIKMAGGIGSEDAKRLAPTFKCEPEDLENPGGKGRFVTQVKNLTQSPAIFSTVDHYMEKMPRMEGADRLKIETAMRQRFSTSVSAPRVTPPVLEKETPEW